MAGGRKVRVGEGEVRDQGAGGCLSKDSGSTWRVASKSTYISTFPGLLASNLLSPAPGLSWQEEMDWLRCGGAWLASGPTEMNPIPYPQPPAVPPAS